jgi:phosphohistidine phosphatase SixA
MPHEGQPISRRALVGSAAALSAATLFARAQEPEQKTDAVPSEELPRPRTVILVRHGEKNADDPRDPTLSEAGLARAQALLRLLGETKLTHVWSSEYKRTKDFATPVALKNGLSVEAFPARDPLGLAERIKATPPGSVSLVVGHSNTLPVIAKALRASLSDWAGGSDLSEDEYDRFIAITFFQEHGLPTLLELRYGD